MPISGIAAIPPEKTPQSGPPSTSSLLLTLLLQLDTVNRSLLYQASSMEAPTWQVCTLPRGNDYNVTVVPGAGLHGSLNPSTH